MNKETHGYKERWKEMQRREDWVKWNLFYRYKQLRSKERKMENVRRKENKKSG